MTDETRHVPVTCHAISVFSVSTLKHGTTQVQKAQPARAESAAHFRVCCRGGGGRSLLRGICSKRSSVVHVAVGRNITGILLTYDPFLVCHVDADDDGSVGDWSC